MITLNIFISSKKNFFFSTVKFRLSEKHTKFDKNLPYGFDKSADLLSKRQNHEEDFFKSCVLFKKSELYHWVTVFFGRNRFKVESKYVDFIKIEFSRISFKCNQARSYLKQCFSIHSFYRTKFSGTFQANLSWHELKSNQNFLFNLFNDKWIL